MTRALALGLLGVILLVTGCGGTSDPADGAKGSATTVPDYKITVAGDSISIGLGASLRGAVPAGTVVKVIGEEGTGLARPDRFDWPTRLDQLAREFPPQVLVLSLSSNDAQDLTDAKGVVVARFTDSAAWDAEYARRLAAAFDPFAHTGTAVVWVGHVRTAEARVGSTNRHIQQLATTVAAARPWVTVADLGVLLGVGEQTATDCLMKDGLHLTVPCLDRAAAALLPRLPPH